jgi:hypothetical protein
MTFILLLYTTKKKKEHKRLFYGLKLIIAILGVVDAVVDN